MSLKDKLNRYKTHMTKEETKQLSAQGKAINTGEEIASIEIPYLNKWSELQARPYLFDDDYVMVREVQYPLTQWHGRYRFNELADVMDAWKNSAVQHPLSSAAASPGDLVFFDTETTGLHGGVGNTIFLLGYSRIEGGHVVVRQYFLAAPHAEAALYHSFLTDVRDMNHLVTFNGKAFDWPQVKTRHTLIRDIVPQLPSFGHYDLLHGSRRLWKHELESCRLSNIEQHKLGIRRKNDVPGYMAPILYFDYLDNQDPDVIQGVLLHNELDVLSLITLYIHISKLLLWDDTEDVSLEEKFQIAKWYDALGHSDAAAKGYEEVAGTDHSLSMKAKIALGHHYKKQKDWQTALSLWEESLADTSLTPDHDVYLEIAKIYEHQVKDYEKALYYTLQAFDAWRKRSSLLRHRSHTEQTALTKRIERLENRIGRLLST